MISLPVTVTFILTVFSYSVSATFFGAGGALRSGMVYAVWRKGNTQFAVPSLRIKDWTGDAPGNIAPGTMVKPIPHKGVCFSELHSMPANRYSRLAFCLRFP
jgi:hypothetical protein